MKSAWARFRGWPAWVQWMLGVFVALIVIGALAPGDDDEQPVSAGQAETTQVSSADTKAPATSRAPRTTVDKRLEQSRLACRHFRNVAGDVSKGILTDAELRKKLKEIDDNAVIGTPEVQQAATAMLASITTGTSAQLLQSFKDMDAACTAAGQ